MSNSRKRSRPQAVSGNGDSLRARLSARQRPTLSYPLLVDDPTQARERLQKAQQGLRLATLRYDEAAHERARQQTANAERGDEEALVSARRELEARETEASAQAEATAKVEAAQAELDGCYETIRLHAMRPEAYEKLIADHPPTEEQKAQAEPPLWNEDTFLPALLAACADGDMTEADWAALVAGDDDGHGLSRAEAWELRTAVVGLNEKARFADPTALPFASTMTRNWL